MKQAQRFKNILISPPKALKITLALLKNGLHEIDMICCSTRKDFKRFLTIALLCVFFFFMFIYLCLNKQSVKKVFYDLHSALLYLQISNAFVVSTDSNLQKILLCIIIDRILLKKYNVIWKLKPVSPRYIQ